MSLSKRTIKLSEFVKLLRIMQEMEPKHVQSFVDRYMFTDNYAYLKEEKEDAA